MPKRECMKMLWRLAMLAQTLNCKQTSLPESNCCTLCMSWDVLVIRWAHTSLQNGTVCPSVPEDGPNRQGGSTAQGIKSWMQIFNISRHPDSCRANVEHSSDRSTSPVCRLCPILMMMQPSHSLQQHGLGQPWWESWHEILTPHGILWGHVHTSHCAFTSFLPSVLNYFKNCTPVRVGQRCKRHSTSIKRWGTSTTSL
jgi:hypothetical protein